VTSQQVIAVIEEGVARRPRPAAACGRCRRRPKRRKPPLRPASTTPAPVASAAETSCRPARVAAASPAAVNPGRCAGTGRRGAVTKEDIVNYASGKTAGVGGGARPEERVPMTRMRTRIAERMMQSKNSIAMLTSFNEVNLGKVMAMRKELGESFEKANGIKLGFMSFFAKAAANALQRHPIVNASVDGNDIIYHGYADISVAVSTDKGLVTPVLRNVERMSFADIERRDRRLTPRPRAKAA
jgi:2-oxoglutarate dehydrogenase E2 component (dihydrolipoamide succinyltransferase)